MADWKAPAAACSAANCRMGGAGGEQGETRRLGKWWHYLSSALEVL